MIMQKLISLIEEQQKGHENEPIFSALRAFGEGFCKI